MAAPCTGIGWKPRASPANRPTDPALSLPSLKRRIGPHPEILRFIRTQLSIIHIFYLFTTVYLSLYTYIHTCLLLLLLLFEGKMFLYSFLFPSSYGNELRSSPLSFSHSLGVRRKRKRHNISRYNLQGLARTTD